MKYFDGVDFSSQERLYQSAYSMYIENGKILSVLDSSVHYKISPIQTQMIINSAIVGIRSEKNTVLSVFKLTHMQMVNFIKLFSYWEEYFFLKELISVERKLDSLVNFLSLFGDNSYPAVSWDDSLPFSLASYCYKFLDIGDVRKFHDYLVNNCNSYVFIPPLERMLNWKILKISPKS